MPRGSMPYGSCRNPDRARNDQICGQRRQLFRAIPRSHRRSYHQGNHQASSQLQGRGKCRCHGGATKLAG
ncbi:hypothetical protein ATCV1_z654L [Acanthocystis turfacea chlorella virus 1]|uniref:Uncharacterized protein z654L n=1 Tax=Chlorovirus heliozoae TaxID=322019 RepID=A7K9R4_9PHYC|nr:hypothetical protein ATCV1_z654L [Acanthocystis turfacea chlorella virus 1]ABT16788.1 hypothetical protein ATCV1_z654L [Acanthocystis turfacea chlorella virus 1]